MTHHIAILNFKGGVGKTTSTVNIGAGLAKLGKKVLLVDLDAQANLTQSFGLDAPEATVYQALMKQAVLPTVRVGEGLYLAPNDLEMIKSEMELVSKLHREYFLKNSLKDHLENFDYILFDCPPSLGLVVANALFAAEKVHVFVPIESEFLALKGFAMLDETLKGLGIDDSKVFLTKYDRRKILSRDVRKTIMRQLPNRYFDTYIRTNVSLAEAPATGQSIIEYAPSSYGAWDYSKLAKEIVKTIENG